MSFQLLRFPPPDPIPSDNWDHTRPIKTWADPRKWEELDASEKMFGLSSDGEMEIRFRRYLECLVYDKDFKIVSNTDSTGPKIKPLLIQDVLATKFNFPPPTSLPSPMVSIPISVPINPIPSGYWWKRSLMGWELISPEQTPVSLDEMNKVTLSKVYALVQRIAQMLGINE